MSENQTYECENCKGRITVEAGADVPQCCGVAMKSIPLEPCTLSNTAEHTRLSDVDEPCDDGRAG